MFCKRIIFNILRDFGAAMRPIKYLTDEERLQARVQYNQRYHARRKAQRLYPPLPDGPYRVLYADPPWQYYSRDPHYHGHARDHYATLTLEAVTEAIGPNVTVVLVPAASPHPGGPHG
jgi:hypothetical protein